MTLGREIGNTEIPVQFGGYCQDRFYSGFAHDPATELILLVFSPPPNICKAQDRYGIAYIRYALEWLWLEKQTRVPLLRGYNVSRLFEDSVRNKLTQSTERRVKYFKRFVKAAGTERIRLEGIYNYT